MDKDEADESVVEEVQTETPETEVELDQVPDVQGDLIENPVVESADDEEVVETPPDAAEETAETEEIEDEDTEAPASAEPTAETTPDITPETDETGVYKEPTTADPGDFQPKGDYSFEIRLTDGKTVKIASQAEADAFAERLDTEEGLVSASQFAKFASGVARLATGIERERADWQSQKDQFELEQAQSQVRNETVQQWNNEINYLEAKGLLPKISATENADWLGNASSEAVKARMEIFNWMEKENQARDAAGIPHVNSVVDAFRMMQAEQQQNQLADERIQEGNQRRAKGAMVGGNSPYIPSNAPKNSIIGMGGSLRDLVTEATMNL